MKSKILIIIFCFFVFALTALAQNKRVEQIDEFGRIPCGDFMARMQWTFIKYQESTDSKIYVVYYGGRFRKENIWNKKNKRFDKIKLTYSHRDDGLNWAKSIPLYLTSDFISTAQDRLTEDKIVLINGGYREDTQVEIWIVSDNAEMPEPTPTVAEKDIKFRNDKPSRISNFTNCYGDL